MKHSLINSGIHLLRWIQSRTFKDYRYATALTVIVASALTSNMLSGWVFLIWIVLILAPVVLIYNSNDDGFTF